MRQDVVVPRTAGAAPESAIAVRPFLVNGFGQAFADQAPLHLRLAPLLIEKRLVHAPTHRAVVNDDVVALAAETVLLFARLRRPGRNRR